MVSIASPARWFAVLFLLLSAGALEAAEPKLPRQLRELNDITGTDAIEARINLLAQAGEKTRPLLKRAASVAAKADQPFNYNALVILARTAHELQDVEAAERFYRLGVEAAIRLQSGQEAAQTLGGLIDLFYENRQFDRTVSVCQELLGIQGNESIDRLKPVVMERLLEALTQDGKLEQALKLVEKLAKAEEKDGWYFLRIKGDLLYQAQRTEEAAKVYEVVLKHLEGDEALNEEAKHAFVQQVRYALSGAYTELNRVDEATELLRLLLKEKPDEPIFNNDLGYLWADHDRNLEEAEKLIRKALCEARKRGKASTERVAAERKEAIADYRDSLGWVLFKQGRYAEAKNQLLRAVKDNEKPHTEILEHLADIHLALGERDEARKVYQQAVEAAGDTPRDQRLKGQVEQKLQMLGDQKNEKENP